MNPIHPGCTNPSRPHGKTKAGSQRWRCPDCGKVWTEGGRKPGRPKGDRPPLTVAERCRRYQAKIQKLFAERKSP